METILLTADFATFAYVLAQSVCWSRSSGRSIAWFARPFWTIACVILWVHVLCAFGIAHHWSHFSAWEHTAARMSATVGWNSGLGLLINEALLLWWSMDVLWIWLFPASYERRSRWWTILLESYLAFMYLNAAVIFVPSERRWLGVVAMTLLGMSWLCSLRRRN